jgi:hypothetical protein
MGSDLEGDWGGCGGGWPVGLWERLRRWSKEKSRSGKREEEVPLVVSEVGNPYFNGVEAASGAMRCITEYCTYSSMGYGYGYIKSAEERSLIVPRINGSLFSQARVTQG